MLRFWPHTHTHEHRLHINRSPLNNFYNPHPHIRLFMYTYIKKAPSEHCQRWTAYTHTQACSQQQHWKPSNNNKKIIIRPDAPRRSRFVSFIGTMPARVRAPVCVLWDEQPDSIVRASARTRQAPMQTHKQTEKALFEWKIDKYAFRLKNDTVEWHDTHGRRREVRGTRAMAIAPYSGHIRATECGGWGGGAGATLHAGKCALHWVGWLCLVYDAFW